MQLDKQHHSGKRYRQGIFKPKYPAKYIGDLNNIIYRSSWELRVFQWCDRNVNVLEWGAEQICIPYMKPLYPSGFRPARYFPDVYVLYKNSEGKIIRELVEIKPLKQTRSSRAKKAQVKLQENYVYLVNEAKWHAARQWCAKNGIEFRLLTETALYHR
jgi:hypothetical protein